jgi:hypothetical protein
MPMTGFEVRNIALKSLDPQRIEMLFPGGCHRLLV